MSRSQEGRCEDVRVGGSVKKIKFLVNNEQEFMNIFDSEEDFNFVELNLGIEFAFEDGKYQSDIWEDDRLMKVKT